MRQHGGPLARRYQKILVGPWVHSVNQRVSGHLDFGEAAVVGIDGMTRRWMDRWVKGMKNNVEKEPPVRFFVMGENIWRDEEEWPLARARETNVYLSSGGHANSLFGDGVLLLVPKRGAAADHYAYNPENPVPTLGGSCLCALNGPTNHAPIERRDDVLVYTSEPLKELLEVTGFVKMTIFVASDAMDTDFVARLCDLYPDGRSIILCDGVFRMRFREGLDRERMMTPGKTYELEIDMGVTSNVFLPGHCLRLEITSSCFPRWARNLNTGEPVATATRMKIARQTVFHSSACPSRLRLPVIPR
jgi:putative CocE/NonD family hydrolase